MITWQTACDEITINYGNANFNRCCVTHGQSRNYRTFQMIRRSLGVHFTSARWVCQAYTNENFIIHHPFYLVESSPSKLWSWDQSENLLKGTIRTVVKALCLTDTHLELHRSNAKCLFQKSELHIVALLITGEVLDEVVVELFRTEYLYLKSKASLVQCIVSLGLFNTITRLPVEVFRLLLLYGLESW